MANACALVALKCAATDNLNIKFIVRVNLLHHPSTNAQDLQHTCCSTSEDDDSKHDDDKNCSSKSVAVVACQSSCKSNTYSTTQACPIDHGLVCVRYLLLYRVHASSSLTISRDGIDGFR